MRLAGYGHESNYSLYEADNNLQHGGQLSMIGGRVERNFKDGVQAYGCFHLI